MRKKYIDRIVNWVLHLTSYPGELCKGYKHNYDIPIKDVFKDNVFMVGLVVNNGSLGVKAWTYENGRRKISIVPEEELSDSQVRTIYFCLKSIDLFKP